MELGWETNHANKYTILNNLRSAVEDGQLVINDVRILKEMRSFISQLAGQRACLFQSSALQSPPKL